MGTPPMRERLAALTPLGVGTYLGVGGWRASVLGRVLPLVLEGARGLCGTMALVL